jgi:ferredoxin
VAHVVCEPCRLCEKERRQAACVQACPEDCFHADGAMIYIHPELCTDCGQCVPVCPERAIFHEDIVPDEWQDYVWRNYEACALGRLERCRPSPQAGATGERAGATQGTGPAPGDAQKTN